MCGIIGVTGADDGPAIVLRGLEILEYRGYDSAGIAIVDESGGGIWRRRAAERAKSLTVIGPAIAVAPSGVAIGHTRWATHGGPTEQNAHPHFDCSGRVAVVHNGIIENHRELEPDSRRRARAFSSETDTEVVAHLIEDQLAGGGDAVRRAPRRPSPSSTATSRSRSSRPTSPTSSSRRAGPLRSSSG